MYAEHRYAPPQSRTVSFGAALLINGALIAGLALSVPQFIKEKGPTTLPIRDYHEAPEPPPVDKPEPRPNNERVSTQPPPTAPDARVATRSDNPVETTPTVYPPLPPFEPPLPKGEPAIAEPAPPPALIGAVQDPRYLKDFQPGYPSAELRAQRDGLVRIKVLIGADGRVKAAEQVSATSEAFFEATRRQALSKWRFKPATRGGVPQESWKTLSVRFLIAEQ